ncbi:MAG: hypothetical protein WBC63_09600 [Candidatus Bipolaricaulia bacterium]
MNHAFPREHAVLRLRDDCDERSSSIESKHPHRMESRFRVDTVPVFSDVRLALLVPQLGKILIRNTEPEYISPDSFHAEHSRNPMMMAQSNDDLSDDIEHSGIPSRIDPAARFSVDLNTLRQAQQVADAPPALGPLETPFDLVEKQLLYCRGEVA